MSNNIKKNVVINSLIYSVGGLLMKCCSFFLLPLYTAYLTTVDYGITSIAGSFVSTMSFIVAFSLFSAIMRFFVDLKDDAERLKRFYGTVSVFVFLSSIVFGIVLTIFRSLLTKYVFSGIDYYPIILVCLVSLVFQCQHTIFDNILRSQQKAFKSSLFSILYFLLTVVLNIVFVVIFRMGAVGSLLATLISSAVYVAYFCVEMLIQKTIKICLDWKLLKSALAYSIPIIPHNLSTSIAALVSKVLIGGASSLASVGIYSVSMQFGQIADVVQGYVDNAYGPWLYEKLHNREEDYKNNIRGTAKVLTAVIGLFFLGISLFAQDYIILFVNKEFADAWKYVPLIVTVFAVKTMYYFYVEVLFYYKKASKYLFSATLTSSIINVFLSVFLISMWGIYGSILADFICMIIRVGIVYILSRKFEDIGLYLRDFIVNFFVVEAFMFGGLFLSYVRFQYVFSFTNFIYKIFVIVLYIVFSFILNKKYFKPILLAIKHKYTKKDMR